MASEDPNQTPLKTKRNFLTWSQAVLSQVQATIFQLTVLIRLRLLCSTFFRDGYLILIPGYWLRNRVYSEERLAMLTKLNPELSANPTGLSDINNLLIRAAVL